MISTINCNVYNRKNNISFTGNGDNSGKDDLATKYKNLEKELRDAKKAKKDVATFNGILDKASKLGTEASAEIKDKNIPRVFTWLLKQTEKMTNRTGNKALDTASAVTRVVLMGNVAKEVVGTGIYTVQALTNEDLPKDKRKFVGMYDLAVGVVSTTFSFIFGVGLEKTIKNGYKNLFKPLSNSKDASVRSGAAAAIVGISAFSSFALQTIVGKRIVAPAVATPVAGKLKRRMEEREAAKHPEDAPAQVQATTAPVVAQKPIKQAFMPKQEQDVLNTFLASRAQLK